MQRTVRTEKRGKRSRKGWFVDLERDSPVVRLRMVLVPVVLLATFYVTLFCWWAPAYSVTLAAIAGCLPVLHVRACWYVVRSRWCRWFFLLLVCWYMLIRLVATGTVVPTTHTPLAAIAPYLFGEQPLQSSVQSVSASAEAQVTIAAAPITSVPVTILPSVLPGTAQNPASRTPLYPKVPSKAVKPHVQCPSGAVVWNWGRSHPRPSLRTNVPGALESPNSVSAVMIERALAAYGSPMAHTVYTAYGVRKTGADYIYDESLCYGVDDGVVMGFFFQESRFGTVGEAVITHSPGNLRPLDSSTGYAVYTTWAAGMDALIRELWQYNNWGWTPIEVATQHWAPWSDGNNPVAYAQTVHLVIDDLQSGRIP